MMFGDWVRVEAVVARIASPHVGQWFPTRGQRGYWFPDPEPMRYATKWPGEPIREGDEPATDENLVRLRRFPIERPFSGVVIGSTTRSEGQRRSIGSPFDNEGYLGDEVRVRVFEIAVERPRPNSKHLLAKHLVLALREDLK